MCGDSTGDGVAGSCSAAAIRPASSTTTTDTTHLTGGGSSNRSASGQVRETSGPPPTEVSSSGHLVGNRHRLRRDVSPLFIFVAVVLVVVPVAGPATRDPGFPLDLGEVQRLDACQPADGGGQR